MRVPVSWLRDFITTDAEPRAFAEALTFRGFTVDGISPQPMPQRIVIGRVDTLARHPNADRLLVGTVDVGGDRLQIVTGATNVHQGDKVPIALVGAEVFAHGSGDGVAERSTKRIERSTLRGVESNGMMCSPDELALPGTFEDGILLLEDDAPIGRDFWTVARYGDAVLDVDVPSNRGDCLSIIGLAREAAAGLGAKFSAPALEPFEGSSPCPVEVAIEDPSVCRRLIGQYFAGLVSRRTPMWMVLRLHGAGVRSINWFVDVSNYVQIEVGQPLHFYDADKLRGARIAARGARAGESVTTLDGVVRKLEVGMPVIADGEGPVGVAGIMGGTESGVSDTTRNLFMESPNFVGARIRRASIALGLRSEGALRHEKDLPVELPEIGRRRAAQLLLQNGGTPSRIIDVGEGPGAARHIEVRPRRVNALLGSAFSTAQMTATLAAIGIDTHGDDPITATIPFWRKDLVEEVDLIEEVARGIGYAAIDEARVVASPQQIDEGIADQESSLAQRLLGAGYSEVVTLTLQGSRVIAAWERSGLPYWSDVVPIVNPLSDEYRLLRPSLVPGLLAAAAKHWTRGEAAKLFEIGHIFREPGSKPPQTDTVRGVYSDNGVIEWRSAAGIAVFADADARAPLDQRLLEVKGDVQAILAPLVQGPPETRPHERTYLHPGAAGDLLVGDQVVAKFGRIHPQLARAYELPQTTYVFAIHLEKLARSARIERYRPLPRFPSTTRDIAVVVGEDVTAGELMRACRDSGAQLLAAVEAFDEYRGAQVGEHKKSIALRLVLRRDDATITDEEANAAVDQVVQHLAKTYAAALRR